MAGSCASRMHTASSKWRPCDAAAHRSGSWAARTAHGAAQHSTAQHAARRCQAHPAGGRDHRHQQELHSGDARAVGGMASGENHTHHARLPHLTRHMVRGLASYKELLRRCAPEAARQRYSDPILATPRAPHSQQMQE
jgi:hypothetical protein